MKKYHHTKETRKKISDARMGKYTREDNPNWKGGRKNNRGYVYIKTPDHPNGDIEGYVFEHRLVVEKIIGRYLTKKERVHHRNETRDDNRVENLVCVKSQGAHIQCLHIDVDLLDPPEIVFNGKKWKEEQDNEHSSDRPGEPAECSNNIQ